jgi:hypothetical protein
MLCSLCHRATERRSVRYCPRCGHGIVPERPASPAGVGGAGVPDARPGAEDVTPLAVAREPMANRIARFKAGLHSDELVRDSMDCNNVSSGLGTGRAGDGRGSSRRAAAAGLTGNPLADWYAQKRAERRGFATAALLSAVLVAATHVAIIPVGFLPFARIGRSPLVSFVRPATPGAWLGEVAGSVLLALFTAALLGGLPGGVEGACLAAARSGIARRWFWFRYACVKGLLLGSLYLAGATCMGLGR